jgi:EAL domain-containing protein (putative c-di-GMP-specific phosphodiesterase class I)
MSLPAPLSRSASPVATSASHPEIERAVPQPGTSPSPAVSGRISAALDERRLLLLLQPIIDAATGRTALYEGLLRLELPDGTRVTAADFIGEAEQNGLVHLVDRRSLELAIDLLRRYPELQLSLNISSLTAASPGWLADLKTLTGSDPNLHRRLTVEITETAMITDLDRVAAFVELLRAEGCRTAIDDFGAGYTSFRHLRVLKVDMLKIDGLFVQGLPNDHKDRALVRAMIDMAKGLGLETVAEWVSDGEAAAFLREAGVTDLQGFLYGEPQPAESFAGKGLL